MQSIYQRLLVVDTYVYSLIHHGDHCETRIMKTKLLAVLSLLLIAGQLTGEENKKSTGTISYIIGTLITISCTHIPVLMYVKIIDKHVCHLVSYVHRVTIDFTTNIHLFSSSHSYLQVREEC